MSTRTPPIPNSEPNANDPHPPEPHDYVMVEGTPDQPDQPGLPEEHGLPRPHSTRETSCRTRRRHTKSRIHYKQIHDFYDFLLSDEKPDATYKNNHKPIHHCHDSNTGINLTSLRQSIPDLMYTLPINHHPKDWQYRNNMDHKHQPFHPNQ